MVLAALVMNCSPESSTATTDASPQATSPVPAQVALPEQLAGRSIHFYLNHPAIDQQAKAYVQGTFQPSDDQATFTLLDSLTTDNEETRAFYYFVFTDIMQQADGALAEVVGSYAMAYAEKFPEEYYRRMAQSTSEVVPRTWAVYNWVRNTHGASTQSGTPSLHPSPA
jgi:hypothetical protein